MKKSSKTYNNRVASDNTKLMQQNISIELLEKLNAYSRKMGVSRANLVSIILWNWVNNQEQLANAMPMLNQLNDVLDKSQKL